MTEPSSRRAPNAWFVDWMSETLFSCDWTLLLSPPYSGVPQQTTDPSLRIAANALSVDWIFVTSPEVETNFPDLSCQIYVILNQSAPRKTIEGQSIVEPTSFQDLPSISIDPVLHDCLQHRRNCPRSPLCRQNGITSKASGKTPRDHRLPSAMITGRRHCLKKNNMIKRSSHFQAWHEIQSFLWRITTTYNNQVFLLENPWESHNSVLKHCRVVAKVVRFKCASAAKAASVAWIFRTWLRWLRCSASTEVMSPP